MKNDVVLAIFLGILSYSMLNIGMGLQKKGASTLPKINEQKFLQNLKNFVTCRPWIIGFIMVQAQWASLSFALDLASVSIITPLMSVGMVALIIFSYFYLKEPIEKMEFISIIGIIVGIVILGLTTPRDETSLTFDYVLERFSDIGPIVFFILMAIITILLMVVSAARKYKNADILFAISAGITDAVGAILLRGFMGGADFRDADILRAAAQQWQWWVLLFLMVTVNFSATIFLQVAYQRGKAVIVAPIFAVLAMIVPVFGGILIFDEWGQYITEGKLGLMAGKIVGLLIVSAGAIVLSLFSARKRKFYEFGIEDKSADDESAILEINEKTNENGIESQT